MRIASMAASRSGPDSAMLGRTLWIATTMDGVLSLGLCSSSVTVKDPSGSRPVASSSVTSASPIDPFDNSMPSNGNRVCPGWSGWDQPRPGDFASTMAAPATSPQSATAQVLLASAFIALLMAVVGTYGVMAYTVARRTREIGVRIALGATTGIVMRDVLGSAARLTAIGVALGLAGAVALGRSMQAILVDTDPTDPGILVGAAMLLGAMALVAGWLPARRASRVDPVTALRAD